MGLSFGPLDIALVPSTFPIQLDFFFTDREMVGQTTKKSVIQFSVSSLWGHLFLNKVLSQFKGIISDVLISFGLHMVSKALISIAITTKLFLLLWYISQTQSNYS